MATVAFDTHDHASCISTALSRAEAHCDQNGLKLTPARRRVLEILLHEHRAVGAYDILEVLRQDGLAAQPPVAYRALDFLVKHGFAHKIERLSAFVACAHPGEKHVPAFLICETCDHVAEATVEVAPKSLCDTAKAIGFEINRTVLEATGLCAKCAPAKS
ncbi:MAG: transcriptional repressor [Marinovum sp.]|nr:transcriptional repressor [Marinovum sp.]